MQTWQFHPPLAEQLGLGGGPGGFYNGNGSGQGPRGSFGVGYGNGAPFGYPEGSGCGDGYLGTSDGTNADGGSKDWSRLQ